MKTLTTDAAADWVQKTGLAVESGPQVKLAEERTGYVFTVRWPKILPYQVPHFANLFLPEANVGSLLFWLRDNGASGAMEFELAFRPIRLLRSAHGEDRPILESPAYLLEAAEIVDARILVAMAVLFSWDAYVIPNHGRYFVWIDDDEAADVWCRNREDYDTLLSRFRGWGLTPEVSPES